MPLGYGCYHLYVEDRLSFSDVHYQPNWVGAFLKSLEDKARGEEQHPH